MSPRILSAPILAALSLASAVSAPTEIVVRDEIAGRVSPLLFGHFVELTPPRHPGGERGADAAIDPLSNELRGDVSAALEAIPLPVLRYPGGAIVEAPSWRWTQLIDGAETITGDQADERRHAFGLHAFLDLCAARGAEPLFVVKLADVARGGPAGEAALRQARACWAYVNGRDDDTLPADLRVWPRLRVANGRAEPWRVRRWQLGNEFTWGAIPALRRSGLDSAGVASAYVNAVARLHSALRALDPAAEFLVEIDMEMPSVGVAVTDELIRRLDDPALHFAAHRYFPWAIDVLRQNGEARPLAACDADTFWLAAVSAPGVDERGQARYDSAALAAARRHGRPLALTEWNWNGWWAMRGEDNASGPNDLWTKAVGAASMLHGFMNASGEISLATQSMLLGTAWDIRGIDAATRPASLRPGARVLALHARHHGSERLAWKARGAWEGYRQEWTLGQIDSSEFVAWIDCVVTRSPKAVFVHLINRRPHSAQGLRLDLSALPDISTGEYLHIEGLDRSGDFFGKIRALPDTSLWEITLTPASVQVFRITRIPRKRAQSTDGQGWDEN